MVIFSTSRDIGIAPSARIFFENLVSSLGFTVSKDLRVGRFRVEHEPSKEEFLLSLILRACVAMNRFESMFDAAEGEVN